MAKLKDAIKNLGNAVNNKEPEGYYVTDMLKSFGTDLTGTQIEGKGITDVLNDIADNYSGGGGSAVLVEKTITDNGVYTARNTDNADGYSVVTVDVQGGSATLGDLNVSENGTYSAQDEGVDGYSMVFVDVPSPNLIEQTFSQNGTYNAQDEGADGYATVTVDIQGASFADYIQTRNLGAMNLFAGANETTTEDINTLMDGIDTSSISDWTQCFSETGITDQPTLDFSGALNCESMFSASSLTEANFNMPLLENAAAMFADCLDLTSVSIQNTSSLENASGMFAGCTNLTNVNLTSASNIQDASDMFNGCSSLEELYLPNIGVNFDISASTEFTVNGLRDIISNLKDLSSEGTSATLTMGSTNIAKLTQDDLDNVMAKGWSLA